MMIWKPTVCIACASLLALCCGFSDNQQPTMDDVYRQYELDRFISAKETMFKLVEDDKESIFDVMEKDIAQLAVKAKEHQEHLKKMREEEEERKRLEAIERLRTRSYDSHSVRYSPSSKHQSGGEFLGDFRLTFYCPCVVCSEQYGDNTSTGVKAVEGVTVAVDPKVIPYGTRLYIEGFGEFIAQDCGGAIKGNRIDIYVEDHDRANDLGVKYASVYEV